jgi:hypothetical protein
MARLAWIASEVGSATGFPKENNDSAEAPNPTRVGNDGQRFRNYYEVRKRNVDWDGIFCPMGRVWQEGLFSDRPLPLILQRDNGFGIAE